MTAVGSLAEFELIRARTAQGRARAVVRGVKLGRKPKLTPHQRKEALRRKANGDVVRDCPQLQRPHECNFEARSMREFYRTIHLRRRPMDRAP